MAWEFANFETTALWVHLGMYAFIAALFGIRTLRDLWNYNEVKDCWSITLHRGHYADHQSHILGINLFDCLYHLLRLGDLLSCEQSNPMFWVASIFSNVSLRISCTTCPSVIFKKQKNACLFHSKILLCGQLQELIFVAFFRVLPNYWPIRHLFPHHFTLERNIFF